jgi:negative regulator of sigma E activity
MDDRTPLEKRSREILEESTARLDGRTLSRLTRARHAALEARAKPVRPPWMSFAPAGAAAVAVLAVVMWSGNGATDPTLLAQGAQADDIELLADGEAPDFTVVAEDLEFYEWAADEVET